MQNRNYKIIILTIVVVFFYLYQSYSLDYSKNFVFNTVKNKKLELKTSKDTILIEEFKGKIVFLKVFGWNCQYCQKEIPELIKLKKNFKNAFDVVAIEAQHHSNKENMNLIEKNSINYNIVNGDTVSDFLDYLKERYGWNGVVPMTIVISVDGEILAFEVGSKSYSLTTLLHTTLKLITKEALPVEKKGEELK